ncbi:arabinose efflux permease family protein [Burkholderia sp. Ch1-1]|uniref:Arabinose efflux permease family protein n=1 Tax=Paraburkholderia dioscoreae TaxID=2604047 RepID=A0A5Q4Z5M8_9BURK|nr:arabinose efflux permease family protein [Burkholderia sp. Ch1-1]VVD26695.1 Arabinose efflux permease family protein [Paraburkholderia dioscoreae]
MSSERCVAIRQHRFHSSPRRIGATLGAIRFSRRCIVKTLANHELHIPARTTGIVLLLCWLAILSEGYDLGVMGTIIPALLKDPVWHLSPLEIGTMGSAALLGTLIGAYAFGVLSDLVGRKRVLIACVALFSLSMLAAANASTPAMFSFVRLIGGLGLGGVISAAATLTVEYSAAKSKNLNFALMYSGYSLGALVSALVGMAFMAAHGWRAIVAVGFLPIVFVPFMMWLLPESLDYLVATNRLDQAGKLAKRLGISLEAVVGKRNGVDHSLALRDVVEALFNRETFVTTMLVWITEFMAILVIYGLGVWLPQIMRKSGYDLGSSLLFLVVFSLASAIGGVLLGRISDRFGAQKTIGLWFFIGALAIAGLSIKSSLLVNYVLVSLAGFGTVSAGLIYLGFIPTLYPLHARTTATGWAVGFGRFGAMTGPLVGGVITGMNVGVTWAFMIFAGAALISCLAILCIPRKAPAVQQRASIGATLNSH